MYTRSYGTAGIACLVRAFVIAVGLAGAVRAAEESTKPLQQLHVSGEAKLEFPVSSVVVELGITDGGETASAAHRAAETRLGAVLTALEAKGIEQKDITRSAQRLWPVLKNRDDPTSVIGYQANLGFGISVSKTGDAGEIIRSALDAGATSIEGVRTTPKEDDARVREALTAAFENAESRARHVAATAGKVLGTAQTIRVGDVSAVYRGGGGQSIFGSGRTATNAIIPKSVEMTVQVTVSFELCDKESD